MPVPFLVESLLGIAIVTGAADIVLLGFVLRDWVRDRRHGTGRLCFICLTHAQKGYRLPSSKYHGMELHVGPDGKRQFICSECLTKAIAYEDALKATAHEKPGGWGAVVYSCPIWHDQRGRIKSIWEPTDKMPWTERPRSAEARAEQMRQEALPKKELAEIRQGAIIVLSILAFPSAWWCYWIWHGEPRPDWYAWGALPLVLAPILLIGLTKMAWDLWRIKSPHTQEKVSAPLRPIVKTVVLLIAVAWAIVAGLVVLAAHWMYWPP